MKCNLIVAGVGGQGILLPSVILASAALSEGLNARQSEVHGMAQRGGAVQAHLRLSDSPIYSELIPEANADLILAMEALEGLRYIKYLSPDGVLLTSSETIMNIPDYPDPATLLTKIRTLPNAAVIDAVKIARESGSAQASNMVMLGAAMRFLPVRSVSIENKIRDFFSRRSEKLVAINLTAFHKGEEASPCQMIAQKISAEAVQLTHS